MILFQGQRRERRRLRHVPREPDPSSAGHRLHLLLDFGLQGVEENAASGQPDLRLRGLTALLFLFEPMYKF